MRKPITHWDVLQALFSENKEMPDSSRWSLQSCAKRWCTAFGLNLEDSAEKSLGTTFEQKMQEYQAQLNKTSPSNARAGKNVRSAALQMRRAFQALMVSLDLPADFNAAFRAAMDAKQYKPADLNRILKQKYYATERPNWYGAQLYNFYDGSGRPGKSWRGDSHLLLSRCEQVLDLQPGVLTSRAYPSIEPILLGRGLEIGFRTARSAQSKANYRLRKLPAQIQTIWTLFVDWRHKDKHIIDGTVVFVQALSLWATPGTVAKHLHVMLQYCGWLCLPAPVRPLSELSKEERWMSGMGLKPQDLRMAHLLDFALLLGFIDFQRFRQHNGVYTKSHLGLLMLANSFVSMPYSFLRAHPHLAEEFGLAAPVSKDAWASKLDALHRELRALIRGIKGQLDTPQRSADEPLRHVLDQEAPYALFLELIERMESSEPLRALKQTWSMWARDLAVFRMEMEVPLRSKNLRGLRMGTHLTRTENGLWSVYVRKPELKNHFSGHAEDISRSYSAETSAAIDRYINEARPNLVGFDLTNVFLLGPACGRRANEGATAKNDFMVSVDTVHSLVGKHLKRYFGQTQGPNIFRHITATSILKDDPTQVDVVAAVLNNSPNTVRMNYKHLTQADGLRLGKSWVAKQAARRRKPPKQQ
jgi:hypothetical protein